MLHSKDAALWFDIAVYAVYDMIYYIECLQRVSYSYKMQMFIVLIQR